MTSRPIIDAGPGLNFLSLNQERLLISILGKLSAPEVVRDEILRKADHDRRFAAAARKWKRLAAGNWIEILCDDSTLELEAVVRRMTRLPISARRTRAKDLGETMVIAHAVVLAEAGGSVTVLIDDGEGAKLASAEVRRLNRLRAEGRPVGSIALASTITVLKRAAGGKFIPDRGTMQDLYGQLRALDDGLVPIESSGLLDPSLWRSAD